MATGFARYELGVQDRLGRSHYEVLRDRLDMYLIRHALIDSYWNFQRAGEPYPFVPRRELKPGARVKGREFVNQNTFLVLFCEGRIPARHRRYIRYFDSNRVTKKNINEMADIELSKGYTRNLRYLDNPFFESLLLGLTSVDYALLIQEDPSIKRENRYVLSHFHVKIDWPIDYATEEMARQLRYISKKLYENGERYAENLRRKLFEKYGFHHAVGGRRTAAVVAAQLLEKTDFIFTVYVASSEGRTLTRISEQGVTKFVLLNLTIPEIARITKENQMDVNVFVRQFLVDKRIDHGISVFQVLYSNSEFAKPPRDEELRRLRPGYNWLTVSKQFLIPLADYPDAYPIPYRTIYGAFQDADLHLISGNVAEG